MQTYVSRQILYFKQTSKYSKCLIYVTQLNDHFLNYVILHATALNWHFHVICVLVSLKQQKNAFSHSLADKELNLLVSNRTKKRNCEKRIPLANKSPFFLYFFLILRLHVVLGAFIFKLSETMKLLHSNSDLYYLSFYCIQMMHIFFLIKCHKFSIILH